MPCRTLSLLTLGVWFLLPGQQRDVCEREKHVEPVRSVSVFQARPGSGSGWVIALGNGVGG